MMRDRISRPNSSVPNQCEIDGPIKRDGRSMYAGSCGAIHGAKSAQMTNTVIITAPAVASRLCRAARCNAIERAAEAIVRHLKLLLEGTTFPPYSLSVNTTKYTLPKPESVSLRASTA
jgi:hypothetical protein